MRRAGVPDRPSLSPSLSPGARGYHARRGAARCRSRFVLLFPAANRDPEGYEDPGDIDVHRTNLRQHVGFGWGIHLCLGTPLARMEAKVMFERLLARTSSFSIDIPPRASTITRA